MKFLKNLLALGLGLFLMAMTGGQAFAEEFECKLIAGEGPFSSFKFAKSESSAKLSQVSWTAATGAVAQYRISRVKAILNESGKATGLFYFETANDWGAGRLIVSHDDEATHAFITWESDSGTLSGYYSCL